MIFKKVEIYKYLYRKVPSSPVLFIFIVKDRWPKLQLMYTLVRLNITPSSISIELLLQITFTNLKPYSEDNLLENNIEKGKLFKLGFLCIPSYLGLSKAFL